MTKKVWKITENSCNGAIQLSAQLGISLLLSQLLINRGITEPDIARAFLAPDLAQLHDPFQFKDMKRAIERIGKAITNQEQVLIYGDYDVDGITSIALIIRVLGKYLPGKLLYYIPKRLEEGYGLHLNSLMKALSKGVSLIITVDCGISAIEETGYLKSRGIDLIITDHHEPPPVLPDAYAIINPKVTSSGYPFQQLAGVGVTFKLLQAMITYYPDLEEKLLGNIDLVAFGTVADIVPLLGENRILVKYGLSTMQTTKNVGLQALLQTAGLKDREITAGHISYILAPRINAAGRMGNPGNGVKLFIANDPLAAQDLAKELEKENQTRQEIENIVLQDALTQIQSDPGLLEENALLLTGENWHLGVIGIVASKLVEIYNKPTILIGMDGEEGRGSGRSIPGFNLFNAIETGREYLIRYGGHEFAAGITITRQNIPSFKKMFLEISNARLTKEDLIPFLKVESLVDLNHLTLELAQELGKLAPCGPANPTPILGCRALNLIEHKNVGENGRHLKIKVAKSNKVLEGIGFNLGFIQPELASTREVDLAFSLEENNWNGSSQVQLNLKDIIARGSS
jgi:single-stranded-DNA-specific exonuclease